MALTFIRFVVRLGRVGRLRACLLLLAIVLLSSTPASQSPPNGHLELVIVEARLGEITPARVELLDGQGRAHVPSAALEIAGDCGWVPVHNWIGWTARWQMRRALRNDVANPYSGTTQFYLTVPVRMPLRPGQYALRVFKGIEYKALKRIIEVRPNETTTVRIELERWIDLPAEGWYGADDHLHIPRPDGSFDEMIAKWMQAEDLHIANLLQMGLAHSVHITPQHSFGKPSVYRLGETLVASGQENPRTHVLGHAITLGSSKWIDFPETYMHYDRFWREARREGAINGFAHWGVDGADEGLAVWAPERLLDFLEVLGFGFPYYDTWYEVLNLGIRMTPTAGTDYPCSPSLPGRERFYTRVDGPLSYAQWIEEVRRGRTFTTNGPVLSLQVNGRSMGDELHLPGPGMVTIEARVRFDPERDDVTRLELVGAGDVLFSTGERSRPGEIRFRIPLQVRQSTWLALRASGEKLGETPVDFIAILKSALTYVEHSTSEALLRQLPDEGSARPSAAHTAPVYLTVAGTPPIAAQPKADQAARAWLARLDELERRLGEDRIARLAGFSGRGDGLTLGDLHAGRAELLRAIARARGAYQGRRHAQGPAP